MADNQKILLCGDVNGNFNKLFSRAESVIKKSGPFDVLLCVGNFFGEDNGQLDAYKMGTRTAPIQTYVFGPSEQDHVQYYCKDGEEIVTNVVYMGRRGLFTTSAGIKIAYLSGLSRREQGKDIPSCVFEPSDCSAIRDACFRGQAEFRGIDILITHLWPSGVQEDERQQVKVPDDRLSNLIAWLAIHARPRYHIVPSFGNYFERQPYRNLSVHQDHRECATRFLALAAVGNKEKEKWMYACSLQPISKMRMTDLLQATIDETPCPYDPQLLKQHQPGKVVQITDNGQYFFNAENADESSRRKRRSSGDNSERKRREVNTDTCWFCLSSPTVEKHLVITVGTHCYLALPKGPLTPYHVLILPIAHHQSVTRVPDEVADEIKKFKVALKQFYVSMGQIVVFYERNYKSTHLQIQCIPVPSATAEQLLEIFKDEAALNRIPIEVLPQFADLGQVAVLGAPYFHVELPTGEQLFAKTKSNFPLQFGRDVLSSPSILNCEDKADWRQCLLSREEEDKHVAQFRFMFKAFDFTNDDDDDDDDDE